MHNLCCAPLHVHPLHVHQSPQATPSLLCSPQGPDEDDEEGSLETRMRSPWWQRTRLITTVLINLGNIMERADEQILPAGEVQDARSSMGMSERLQQPAALLPRDAAERPLKGLGPLVCNSKLQAHGLQARQQQSHNLQHGSADCASWWLAELEHGRLAPCHAHVAAHSAILSAGLCCLDSCALAVGNTRLCNWNEF